MPRSHTDIQLKTLSRRLEIFNRKIIMRRNSMIFYPENQGEIPTPVWALARNDMLSKNKL